MTPTYVLLHGFTGAPASFDPLLARLPSDARAIRPTLSGHGPSPALAASWDEEIERLAALLRGEQISRAHLVGYSLGGRVGLGLLARAPELFARATLIGAHPGLADSDERAARAESDRPWVALLEQRGLDAFLAEWEALPMWASQARLAPSAREAQRVTRRSHTASGLAHALRVLGLGRMPPADPARIGVPITLVAGALDAKHRALAEAFAPRLKEARLVLVPDAGHNVLLEAPDRLAAILTEAS